MNAIRVFTILVAILSPSTSAAGRFTCYLATWATYRVGDGAFDIENVPGDLCTHAVYSFIGLSNQTWAVQLLDEGLDVGSSGLTRFTGLKVRYPSLKTVVAVGGWGDGGKKYSEMVAVPERRASFIASIVDFLNRYGFDGVDIDWEYPGVDYRGGQPSDKANFVSFVKELRSAFNGQGKAWEISLAVNTLDSVIDVGYDVPSLCQSVDAINAMAYDLHGQWDGYADVHSPLNRRPQDNGGAAELNVNDGIENWVSRGCAPGKIVVGIPFYGTSYNIGDNNNNHEEGTPSVGPGDAGPLTRSPGTLAYYEICVNVNNGWTERWDEPGQVPFAYQGHNWVGYENVRSVQAKVDFIRRKGLGGAMTWTIDMDDFRGTCGQTFPLARAIRNGLAL